MEGASVRLKWDIQLGKQPADGKVGEKLKETALPSQPACDSSQIINQESKKSTLNHFVEKGD